MNGEPGFQLISVVIAMDNFKIDRNHYDHEHSQLAALVAVAHTC